MGTCMFAPEAWPVGTFMPSAWSASTGKRGASAYASCARQVGTCVNAPETLGLTGRSTHGVEGTGADSVGLPLLIFIPTFFGRTSTMPCTFPVGSLVATLPHAWGWPQVKGLGNSLRRSRGLVVYTQVASSAHNSRSRIPLKAE